MRQPYLNIIITVFLVSFTITACKPTSKSEKKVKDLPEKEQGIKPKEVVLSREMQTSTRAISNELSYLNAFDKKYPYEIKLLDHPVLEIRLKKMLGPQFEFLKNIWEVETPIAITNGMFYAWGMQAHSGGDPGAVLIADLNKNVLYVGIRKDEKEKFYSEDGSNVPQKMRDWADEQ